MFLKLDEQYEQYKIRNRIFFEESLRECSTTQSHHPKVVTASRT
jgi:hypothetical protein